MKSKLPLHFRFLVVLCLFFASLGYAQVKEPFNIRYPRPGDAPTLRGDLTVIGNNIVNRAPANDPYSGSTANDRLNMQYINVDPDPRGVRFSSSSAVLQFPQAQCNNIVYAGLYWGATYARNGGNASPLNIQMKLPTNANYVDITGTYVFNGASDPTTRDYSPYIAYADVTNLITAQANPTGEYTVANVRSTLGRRVLPGGVSGGWTLVIIYENPTLKGKRITTFDGFAVIRSGESATINYNGFETIPSGPVRAQLGVGVLEGDRGIPGDRLSISATSNPGTNFLSNAVNPIDNFFNGSISINGAQFNNRTPNSLNTLGWDVDLLMLNNPANSVLPNNETSATFTATSTRDKYDIYFNSFNVEIIEPNIQVQKLVQNTAGEDISGEGVVLAQDLEYVLKFQNNGNDNATGFQIRDPLPTNVNFADLAANLDLPPGVTYTYDAGNHEIVFQIPDNLVEENGAEHTIRINVRVVDNCFELRDACSNIIQNLAYSTYRGVFNNNQITDDPSVSAIDACGFTTPGATNFLVDLGDCDFTRTENLCGESVTLSAGGGFTAYEWRDQDGNIIGTNQSVTVNQVGTYTVTKTAPAPCLSFDETINVVLFGTTQTNPIIPVADEVVTCVNDGDQLPKIFLCGASDSRLLETNISDAVSIVWEKLDEGSCTAVIEDCANKSSSCNWSQVATGDDFNVTDAGEYRLVINYQNGCFSRFYFKVFKNTLDPLHNFRDIICSADGNISITNVPGSYEFQLINATGGAVLVPYQSNPSFAIATPGIYTVEIRQQGVNNGCVFRVSDIGIRERNFDGNVIVTDESCTGDLGSIRIQAVDALPQYSYAIFQGVTVVDTFGPTTDSDHTFNNLNQGSYEVLLVTQDGCVHTETVTINPPPVVTANAVISQSLTSCNDGEITVTASGGTPVYNYAIWSVNGTNLYASMSAIPGTAFQTDPFTITTAGTYEFLAVDNNNCMAFTTITIAELADPEFSITDTDVSCNGANDGTIAINVTNNHGFTLDFTLDGGTSFQANNTFTGLAPNTYTVGVRFTNGISSCIINQDVVITQPTALNATASITQAFTCTTTGTILVDTPTGGTAPYSYSIDGTNFGTNNTFTGLSDGNYSIIVRDSNNCTFPISITIPPLDPPTNLDFVSTTASCPAETSDVRVTVTNGVQPLQIGIISPSSIAATSITGNTAQFDGLAAGNTYTFRVTDANNCTYEENLTIAAVPKVNVTANMLNAVSCVGANDGEGSFTVSTFTTFDYAITNSGGTTIETGNAQNTAIINVTSLVADTYTVTVTDNTTNCTDTASFTITEPANPLAFTFNFVPKTCSADGSVTISATGGWGGYTFSLRLPDATVVNNGNNSTFNNLSQNGTYTISVTDTNNCAQTQTFTQSDAVAPVLAVTPNDICYVAATGLTLNASVTSGGDGNFRFRLNGGTWQTSGSFAGLTSGTYTVEVIDGNDCTDSQTITIDPELELTADSTVISSCGATSDVTINATGGDGNYSFAVVASGSPVIPANFGGANVITVTGAGIYDVYVRDKNGGADFCEATTTITVTQDPALSLAIADTPILCNSGEGSISLTGAGGNGVYQYSIVGVNGGAWQSSGVFTNLTAALYTVRVRDGRGCILTNTHDLTQPPTLSASAAVTDLIDCTPALGANVQIFNALGGTLPYSYSFDGGATWGASDSMHLPVGTHTLFVRDANNCTVEMTVTVAPPLVPPVMTPTITYDCDGFGEATLTSNQPSYNYSYSLNGGTPQTSPSFTGLTAGAHNIRVDFGASISPSPSTLLLENFGSGVDSTEPSIDPRYCFEPQNFTSTCLTGIANDQLNDGEYSVTNRIVRPYGSWLSPNDHSGIANGRFLAINVGGTAGVNGIIYAKRNITVLPDRDIEVSLFAYNLLRRGSGGGDPSIVIELVNSTTNTVISSNSTGSIPKNRNADDWRNYSLTLNPGNITTVDIVIRTNSAVINGNDIAIDDISAIQFPQACDSSVDIPVVIEGDRAFEASLLNTTHNDCNGDTDGTIQFEVRNFGATNGFNYLVTNTTTATVVGTFNSTTSPVTINNLAAGDYTIAITDVDNACTETLNVTITEPAALSNSASITEVLSCTNGGATITATASGGTTAYTYQLEESGNPANIIVAAQSSGVFTAIAPGDYVVRTVDANNCEVLSTPITVVANATPSFTAAPTNCYDGLSNGTITVNAIGNGNFIFRINGGAWVSPSPAATTHTFTGLAAGTYRIEVRDELGCEPAFQDITINDQLLVNPVVTRNLTCLVDAQITVNTSGGLSPYTFEWSNDGGTTYNTTNFVGNVFTTNTAGTYQFRVTDSSTPANCLVESTAVTIVAPVNPDITSVTASDATCNGYSNGFLTITTNTSLGLAPFTINVRKTSGTAVDFGTRTSNLPAGDYEITLTDANGCTDVELATIGEPAVITYNTAISHITCDTSGTSGSNNIPGSISISNVAGGTAEYIYFITGNNGYSNFYRTTAGGEDHAFTILDFGVYRIDIIDANGCSSITTEIIASPPNDLDISVNASIPDCNTGGTVTVEVGNPVGPINSSRFEFGILTSYTLPYAATYFPSEGASNDLIVFDGTGAKPTLLPGVTYTFVVRDNLTNCYYFETSTTPIPTLSNMQVKDLVANPVTCTGAADGNVTFTFFDYDVSATSVTYEVVDAFTGIVVANSGVPVNGTNTVNPPTGDIVINNLGPLPPGVYNLILREIGGIHDNCSVASAQFTIEESTLILTGTVTTSNDNCQPNQGVITANGLNGTAPYTFIFEADPAGPGFPATPLATDPRWDGAGVANVENGDYVVFIKDAFGCIINLTTTVGLDPSPVIALDNVAYTCDVAGNQSAEVTISLQTAGIAPYAFSTGGAFTSVALTNAGDTFNITGLAPGTHTITVRDANDCSHDVSVTIHPKMQFTASVSKLLDCNSDGEILIEVPLGSGNYEYEIDGPAANDQARGVLTLNGFNQFTWTNAAVAGVYAVTVYDTTTPDACAITQNITLDPAIMPDIAVTSSTDVSCNTTSDASILVSSTDVGTGAYTFEIISAINAPAAIVFPISATSSTHNTAVFDGLDANTGGTTYTIQVTAANGCTATTTQIIDKPEQILVPDVSVVEFACSVGNTTNMASITVDTSTITGGSGTYVRYEFIRNGTQVQIGPNATYTETNLAGGNYVINVYDSNNCVGTANAVIVPFDAISNLTIAVDTAIVCGATEAITASITSTATNIEYELSTASGTIVSNYVSNSGELSHAFTGLDIGNYIIRVYNLDTGCVLQTTHQVNDPNTFSIGATKLSDISCVGASDGSVRITTTDATYTGDYTIIVQNDNGTPLDYTDDTNAGLPNPASITGNGTVDITGLVAGGYSVLVTQDSAPSCEQRTGFTINEPAVALSATLATTDISCVGNDGAIAITATGGWGNYVYFVGTTNLTTAQSVDPTNYSGGPNYNSLAPGTYFVWVLDNGGCAIQLPNVVLSDPVPIAADLRINQFNCNGTDGIIEVVNGTPAVSGATGGQGSNYSYQLIRNGGNIGVPVTSPIFTNLGPGTYTVLITDQWSCSFTTAPVVLHPEMDLTAVVTQPIFCGTDGIITIQATGGSGNFNFQMTTPGGTVVNNTTGVFNGLTEVGTYSFVVGDTTTGTPAACTKTITQDLVAPLAVDATVSSTNVSCNGGSDGSIRIGLDASHTDNPYTYAIVAGPSTVAAQANPVFSNLVAGTYTVRITSAKECFEEEIVTITEPVVLSVTAVATDFACNVNNSVSQSDITVTALGGTAPYSYSLDGTNFQTSNVLQVNDTGAVQNLTITVQDANGCTTTVAQTVNPLPTITAVNITQNTAISCINPEEVTVTVTGGSGDFTFDILPVGGADVQNTVSGDFNAIFDLTTVGSYVIRVTDDSTGCFLDSAPYEIAPFDNIHIVATATVPVSCFGGNDGAATVSIEDYVGNYTYEVFNADGSTTGITSAANTTTNPISITGLTGGNYFVRITETDMPLCTEDSNVFTIVSPDLPLTATIQEVANVTCDNNQGAILITPNGGYAPYDIVITNTTTSQTYTQNNVVSSHTFTELSAGSFTVSITDNGGCNITDTILLTVPTPITASIAASPMRLQCFGMTNATVTATNVLGGQGANYLFTLNTYDAAGTTIVASNGPQSSASFDNLGAGTYSITVSDGWNCTFTTATVTISQPDAVVASLIQLNGITCTNNAQLQLSATGGVGPYEFSTDNITYTPMSGGNTHTVTVGAGVHRFYVRDASNCVSALSNEIVVDPLIPLSAILEMDAAVINCNGGTNATIHAKAQNGLGNYTYELLDTSSNVIRPAQNNGIFTNVAAGIYQVRITSGDCLEIMAVPEIMNPPTLNLENTMVTNVSCSGENDGTISVTASGGTGEIIYSISPNLDKFDTVNTFTDLAPGLYDVIVQDENGCFIPLQFTIIEPSPIEVLATNVVQDVCAGDNAGQIEISITGGIAPYRTSINSTDEADFVNNQTSFTNLPSGTTHVIFVRDANDCEANVAVELPAGPNLNATLETLYLCTTNVPTADVEVTLEDTNVAGDVLYALDSANPADMQISAIFQNVAPGNHSITIAHSNGCVRTLDFTIDSYAPLTVNATQGTINEIVIDGNGGRPDYTYFVNDENIGKSTSYFISQDGIYTIRVIDENGCEAVTQIEMEFIDIEIPDIFTPDGDGLNDTWRPVNQESWPNILTRVYDRYGREVARLPLNEVWDGTYNGTELPTGDYWYVLKLNGNKDAREFVGHFTLYR